MRRLLGGVDSISEWSGKVTSMFILVILGIMLYEIVVRYIFNAPTIWVHETSRMMFGAYSVLMGAHVLLHQQHVKMDVFYSRFSPRGRAILDSVSYLLFSLFIVVLLVQGWRMSWLSVKVRELSQQAWHPPVYPFKITLPLGAFLILLQGLAHYIRALSMAIRGRELA